MDGKLLFIVPNTNPINATYAGNGTWWAVYTFDDYGEYEVNATFEGLDNVTINNATITVDKLKTELSATAITTTYNINKDLVITLKDSTGKALTGVKVTVDLNGAKEYTTDKNGQVKISTKGLAPKTYNAKITFNGETNYDKSTKDVKVTVKKATPKITAKKKTFKKSVKTKKYTITLKDNAGKPIKNAKVTLKVKGKTYKAKTNSKGKATFKITKLNKKGTFKAVIKYKGNKYYKKLTKKVKINVIVSFKTVSKGSKDKSTVKEIQQVLKDNGYYISYRGHYLKVDGKYNSCTVRSVKEFQNDKGLKVTGKVDEKTAIKLGIIN
ncbi:peptidoglycan-binding protein [Methanobrevibacter sp.]|uniref:peptidoglycan-binding domain-containing protein n=1 Tax=Methanobrevibacter sp. TaxID=66852 RepID=UPI0025DE4D17|nr:peptidoglycan-binding domain-containing protein [Methanobrevibacter sp.]MBR4448044.1 peptidoglycan-binding protein [Methanobrevibacter sp.]